MPDAIPPVGEMAQVPQTNPIGTLSSLVGLQQQQQNLQTGQYIQGQQQAGAQQAQQQMRERQWLQQTMQTGKDDQGNSIYGPNGEINPQTMIAAVNRNMPLTGQPIIQNVLKTQNDKVNLDEAVQGLQGKYRSDIGGILKGFIGSNAQPQQINAALDQYATQNPDAVSAVHWGENLVDHLGNMQGPQRDTALSHLIGTFTGTSAQTPTTVNTHAGVQGGTVNTATGAITTAGNAVPFGLAPTEQIPYVAAQAAAQAGAAGRAGGMATTDIGRLQQVSSAIAPSAAAIPLTQEIDSLADQIHSGKFAAEISKAAAALGQSSDTYARQILTKDLGQVETRATDFGNPTDKKLGTILSGFPDPTSDNRTIHTAMDYVRGSFRQNVARGQNMLAYQKAHPDAAGFQQSDDQLTSKVDPLTAEYRALKPGTARQGFLQRNFKGADEAQAFASQAGQ